MLCIILLLKRQNETKTMFAYYLKDFETKLVRETYEYTGTSDRSDLYKVISSGINRRDLWIQRGLYPGIELPCVLGSDGLVEKDGNRYLINPNIDWGNNPKVPSKNYHILGLKAKGTFAEFVQLDESRLVPVPKHLSPEGAGVLGLSGLTAYRALVSNCQVQATDRVFINGIGGAVALFAMQFALAIGCEVHVSSSSEEKIERAIALGATGGVNYKNESWGKEYKKQQGGFDVIIDSAGGNGFNELINLCNIGGRIGIFGGTRGKISNISPQHLFFKQIHIFGSTMGNDIEFNQMVALVDQHQIEPVIDQCFSIHEINSAFEAALSKSKFGKLCLTHE